MDDVDASGSAAASAASAAPALFEDDSDDEPAGIVVRNRHQRSAHKPRPTELVSAKEAKRLRVAAAIKAEVEAAAASKPAVFDVWATDREADLVAGIKPVTDARGFRIGRMQQRAFRHHGEEKQKEHVVASTLKNKIHAGASFHPDEEAHQALLRKVRRREQNAASAIVRVEPEELPPGARYAQSSRIVANSLAAALCVPSLSQAFEKDEAERSELDAIRARFNVAQPEVVAPSPSALAAAAAEDDSWMDSNSSATGGKNPVTSSQKFSKTKRNQLARKAANAAKHTAMLEGKALDKFVKRLPVLVAELKKEEKLAAKERARIAQAKALHPDHKPKLGKYEEEELFPDVALTDELPEGGSLRKLTPSAHVVKDQFARFQERHLIETRKKVKKHRGMKPKVYERFKDDPEPMPTLQAAAASS